MKVLFSDSRDDPSRKFLLASPSYNWGRGGKERCSHVLRVARLGSDRAWILQSWLLNPHIEFPNCTHIGMTSGVWREPFQARPAVRKPDGPCTCPWSFPGPGGWRPAGQDLALTVRVQRAPRVPSAPPLMSPSPSPALESWLGCPRVSELLYRIGVCLL